MGYADEVDTLFSKTPAWVNWVLTDYPASGTPEQHQQRRTEGGFSDRPWLEYMAGQPGLNPYSLVRNICEQTRQVQAVALDAHPRRDLTKFFPEELAKKYWVTAFNKEDVALSLVLLEPDIIVPLYKDYVLWTKTTKPCVLQFFLTTPEMWHEYQTTPQT